MREANGLDNLLAWITDDEVMDHQRTILSSVWEGKTLTLDAHDVPRESMRLMMGLDPASDGSGDPVFGVQVRGRLLRRPQPPRKRRGLTGKRYRIARRRYAREVRAWKRGIGEPVQVHYYVPHARIIDEQVRRTLDRKASFARLRAVIEQHTTEQPIPFVLPDLRDRNL